MGDRFTRSAVCTSSILRSLRPCWTALLEQPVDCAETVRDRLHPTFP